MLSTRNIFTINIPYTDNEFIINNYASILTSILRKQGIDILYIRSENIKKSVVLTAIIEEICIKYFMPVMDFHLIQKYENHFLLTDTLFYEYLSTLDTIIIDDRLLLPFNSDNIDTQYMLTRKDEIKEEITSLMSTQHFVTKYYPEDITLIQDLATELKLEVKYVGNETIMLRGEFIDIIDVIINIKQGKMPLLHVDHNTMGHQYFTYTDDSYLVEFSSEYSIDKVADIFLEEDEEYIYVLTSENKVILDLVNNKESVIEKWINGFYLNKWGKFIYNKYKKITKYGLKFE